MARLQRRISAANVSRTALDQAASALRALPEKPKEIWSLREAVISLQEPILDALNKGYSYEEVAKMLTKQGVEISASSLKSYLSSARRQQEPTGQRTRRNSRTAKSVQADKLEAIANQGLDASFSNESFSDESFSDESFSDEDPPAKTTRKAKTTPAATTPAATKSTAAKTKATPKSQPRSNSTAKPKGTRGQNK